MADPFGNVFGVIDNPHFAGEGERGFTGQQGTREDRRSHKGYQGTRDKDGSRALSLVISFYFFPVPVPLITVGGTQGTRAATLVMASPGRMRPGVTTFA